MSANKTLSTVALTSPQAAAIAAWLQRCHLDTLHLAERSGVLEALAAQLDDARWIGRWLREEPRLAISQADAAPIRQAIAQAAASVAPEKLEAAALKHLLSELECPARGQAPPLPYSSAMMLAGAKLDS